SITAMPNGDTQLVAYGLDHVLYHNIRLANGGWQGWAQVPGFGSSTFTGSGPTIAGSKTSNSAQIITVGVDHALYHCIRNPDGTWQGWAPIEGVGTGTTFQLG
ncbi:hypothetical protein ACFZB9_08690, partial [Kitasatospora sp. NPDC008050]|uniref:hypothetical protein n=1 Tax=Kitasatospora sp. NPDC008050 TaxID=3364021 RepID=UPI0036DFBE97